jgi:hypothetical protein
MCKTPQNRIIAIIALPCAVVMAPTLLVSAHKCEARGGVWVRGVLGGWVCVKKKAVLQ